MSFRSLFRFIPCVSHLRHIRRESGVATEQKWNYATHVFV